MNSKEITIQISEAADSLNLKKWDYGASFSNDYSVQVDKGAVSYTHLTLPTSDLV